MSSHLPLRLACVENPVTRLRVNRLHVLHAYATYEVLTLTSVSLRGSYVCLWFCYVDPLALASFPMFVRILGLSYVHSLRFPMSCVIVGCGPYASQHHVYKGVWSLDIWPSPRNNKPSVA